MDEIIFVPKNFVPNFIICCSEYSSIFFVDPTPKNDKNPNLMVKNLNLYKLEFIVALPKKKSTGVKAMKAKVSQLSSLCYIAFMSPS